VLLLFRMIQIQDGRPAWHLIDRDIFNFFMNPTSHEVTRLARNIVFFFYFNYNVLSINNKNYVYHCQNFLMF